MRETSGTGEIPRGLRRAFALSLGAMATTMALALLLRLAGSGREETWRPCACTEPIGELHQAKTTPS